MRPKRKWRWQGGDTLIEITFALSIMSLVLTGSSSVAMKAFQMAQTAKERTAISEEAQAQMEALRAFRDNHPWAEFLNGATGSTPFSGVLNVGTAGSCHVTSPCLHMALGTTNRGTEQAPTSGNMAGSVITSYIEIAVTPDGNTPPQTVDIVLSYGFQALGGGPDNLGHITTKFTNLQFGLAGPPPVVVPPGSCVAGTTNTFTFPGDPLDPNDFAHRIAANLGPALLNQPRVGSELLPFNLPVGTYQISLVSADIHHAPPTSSNSPGEQWEAELVDSSGGTVYTSPFWTTDIPANITQNTTVYNNQALNSPNSVGIIAHHIVPPPDLTDESFMPYQAIFTCTGALLVPPPPGGGADLGGAPCKTDPITGLCVVNPFPNYHWNYSFFNKSNNPGIGILGCTWDWGDGTSQTLGAAAPACQTGGLIVHGFPVDPTYPAIFDPVNFPCGVFPYTVTLTMMLANGSSPTKTVNVKLPLCY